VPSNSLHRAVSKFALYKHPPPKTFPFLSTSSIELSSIRRTKRRAPNEDGHGKTDGRPIGLARPGSRRSQQTRSVHSRKGSTPRNAFRPRWITSASMSGAEAGPMNLTHCGTSGANQKVSIIFGTMPSTLLLCEDPNYLLSIQRAHPHPTLLIPSPCETHSSPSC
jgi:hypothetical protein